ncbi:MAG: DUF2461 domain-containing protein [Gammaproteobacteria bacterium]|nr:DUF2461 domain-containing protein [Gammaproteobacteria bacterium]
MASKSKSSGRNASFKGFPTGMLDFLFDLALNNNREWFTENKPRYEEFVVAPSLDFISAVGERMPKLSEHITCIPKRVGGSLFRIYRDVRFARDKRPYKTNIGIHFRHTRARDAHAPGYYFHIGVDECFLGGGMWRPDGPALQRIRERMIEKPEEWQKILRSRKFAKNFELRGETLKRPPRGFPPDHPYVDDLKRKDFIGIANFDHGLILSPDIVDYALERYAAAQPLMRFLCDSQGLEY